VPELELPQGTIAYRDTGTGPPIVFMHGLLVDGSLWRGVVPGLESSHRCIVPDLPLGAHRRAMRPDADLTPPGVARLVADFMAALDLEDVTLVANDTGGAIAQIVAAHHPERLARLVLTPCDAYENFLPPAFRPLQWIARAPRVADLLLRTMRFGPARKAAIAPVSKRADPELVNGWMRAVLTDADVRRDAIKFLASIDNRYTLEAAGRLRDFHRPVLLAWATEDRFFTMKFAERLAADLPDARIEPVEDSRTFVPVDQPARAAELISAFVRETPLATHAS
jgi:pimeloyl-ACP methyl ester carboxylesterase